MEWIDYRKALGLSFEDKELLPMFSNKINNKLNDCLEIMNRQSRELDIVISQYFSEIGERLPFQAYPSKIADSIASGKTISDVVSKYVALLHVIKRSNFNNIIDIFYSILTDSLNELHIAYETVTDDYGILFFPKGAQELDVSLVSEPLEWMRDYPKSRKTYITALKQYSEGVYSRDAADNLRKSLETFLQEYLDNNKNLESNKNEICKYLSSLNIDNEISSLMSQLLGSYKKLNDRTVKHNDCIDPRLLEFLLYQTGIFIRLLITVRNTI